MNKWIGIGRITKDPDLKYIPTTGTAVATVTVAIDEYNSKTKEKTAEFIPVVVFGKQAENLAQYQTKGSLIAVSGKIKVRSYDAKDGTKRYVTEVVADMFGGIKFLASKRDSGDASQVQDDVFDGAVPVDDGSMPF